MFKHAVSIMWSNEDKGFIATIPGINGLSAFGKTHNEALVELATAADSFFASLKKHQRAIPAPETISQHSGQLRLRMPKSLHAELAEAAKIDGISLNTHIIRLLSSRTHQQHILNKLSRIEAAINATNSRIVSNAASKDAFSREVKPISALDSSNHSERVTND